MIIDQTNLPHTSFYQCSCRSTKAKVYRNLHYLKVQNFWLWIVQLPEQETAVIRLEKRSCHKQCPIVKSWTYIPTCCLVSFDSYQNAVACFFPQALSYLALCSCSLCRLKSYHLPVQSTLSPRRPAFHSD